MPGIVDSIPTKRIGNKVLCDRCRLLLSCAGITLPSIGSNEITAVKSVMNRYECCFEDTGSRTSTKRFGVDCCLLHDDGWMADQETKPNRIVSTGNDVVLDAPSHHDPTLLVVSLENDYDDAGRFVPHSSLPPAPNQQRQRCRVIKKLKVRSSECLILPSGRYHYSALELRQRIALWTGNAVDTDYDVLSSKQHEHVIGLPSSGSNCNILDLFGSRLQLRLVQHNKAIASTSAVLQIQGRHFDFDGTLTVARTTLRFIESTARPYQGTSYTVWDGSLLMARYLEQNPQAIRGHSVLELGSGCGVAGLSAAALGACVVTLTDLPGQALKHLQTNVDCNDEALMECRVEALACDWRDPPMDLVSVRRYNVILVADCIWVAELVSPLFDVLEVMTRPAAVDQSAMTESGKQEDATESTIIIYDDEVEESTTTTQIPIQEIGKYARDERSSVTLDESTHDKFERGCLARSIALEHSTPSVDFEEFASFYEDDITTTRVIISYQRRGKSTHEQFMRRLHDLFSEIEIVEIPGQPDIFTIYSCQR